MHSFVSKSAICWNKGKEFLEYDKHHLNKIKNFVKYGMVFKILNVELGRNTSPDDPDYG